MQVLIKHTQRINSSAKVNGGETTVPDQQCYPPDGCPPPAPRMAMVYQLVQALQQHALPC